MPENSTDDAGTAEVWIAASAYAQAQVDGSSERLADAVRALLGPGHEEGGIYVAKLTHAGLRNQVWQGRSISETNEVMVFLDQTDSPSNVLRVVLDRLNPRPDSGFEAVVIGKPAADGGWEVHEVIQYDHSTLGEQLATGIGRDLSIVKLEDPAVVARNRPGVTAEEAADGLPSTQPEMPAEDGDLTAAEVLKHLYEASNVVLEGPPGTGKTRLALKLATLLSGGEAKPFRLETLLGGVDMDARLDELREAPVVWEIVQLHPAFGYDEFVRGLRTNPDAMGFALCSVDGILPKMARVAALREGKPTLLIVDEINRGNLSAILGETIFAIDPAHRGREVRLQHEPPIGGSDGLRVPRNLFILATMNTADRSIAMLDFAVRRRFRFLHMAPSEEALRVFYGDSPFRAERTMALLRVFTSAVREPELQPGHSYLMIDRHLELDDQAWAERIISRVLHDLRPLFDEYREEGIVLLPVKLEELPHVSDLVRSPHETVRDSLLQWLAPTGTEE